MSISSVNHIKANTLPSTTGFWRQPLFKNYGEAFVSRGTVPAAAVGLIGIWDTFRTAINQDGESFSFWNNLFRPISWALMTGFIYSVTKPPGNLFQTDLVTNSIKDVTDNIIQKVGDRDSLVQILKKESVDSMGTAIDEMMESACDVISHYFDEIQEGRREQMLGEELIGSLSGKGTPLYDLYTEVMISDGAETDPRDRPNKLKELLRDRKGDWVQRLSAQKRPLERKIMAALFTNNGSESPQIAVIRQEINKAIEPLGLTLLAIKYNESSDEVKMEFVNMKGYPGNDNKGSQLHLLGNVVTLNPGTFLNFIIDTSDKITELRANEDVDNVLASNDKQAIERLNKELLAKISEWITGLNHQGWIRPIHVIYDTNTRGYESNNLDPTIRINLSDTLMKKLSTMIWQGLSGAFGSVTGFASGSYGNRTSNDNRDDDADFATTARSSERRPSGGTGYDSGDPTEHAARSFDNKEELREKRERRNLLSAILEKRLGITLKKPGENEASDLTDLKVALIILQMYSARPDLQKFKEEDRDNVDYEYKEYMNKVGQAVQEKLEREVLKVPITPSTRKIDDKYLRLEYFLAIVLEDVLKGDGQRWVVLNKDREIRVVDISKSGNTKDNVDRVGLAEELIRRLNGKEKIKLRMEKLFSVMEKGQADILRRQLNDLLDGGSGGGESDSVPPATPLSVKVVGKVTA